MSDFLFYISLDRVRPEKRRATSSTVVTSRNNKIARSAHPSGGSLHPSTRATLSYARSRTRDREKFFKSHHLGALFQRQIRSRGRGEVFEVTSLILCSPFSSHPLSPLASSLWNTQRWSCREEIIYKTSKQRGCPHLRKVVAAWREFTCRKLSPPCGHPSRNFRTRLLRAAHPRSSRSANMISRPADVRG